MLLVLSINSFLGNSWEGLFRITYLKKEKHGKRLGAFLLLGFQNNN